MLYRMVLTFESVDGILKCDHHVQMKANEQYFPVEFVWCHTQGNSFWWQCFPIWYVQGGSNSNLLIKSLQ